MVIWWFLHDVEDDVRKTREAILCIMEEFRRWVISAAMQVDRCGCELDAWGTFCQGTTSS